MILSWPELGMEVATDGDGDDARDLVVRNTRTEAPNFDVCLISGNGNLSACPPNGAGQELAFGTETGGTFVVYRDSDRDLFTHVSCDFVFGRDLVFCSALRSRPDGA